MTVSYTIAIPARNEELILEKTVSGLVAEFRGDKDVEILIVDNGSSDGTWALALRLSGSLDIVRAEKSEASPGYGVAVRSAIEKSRGSYIVFVMADGSESPVDVRRFIQESRTNPGSAVFGNRFDKGSTISGYPPFKRAINRLANQMLSFFVGKPLPDLTNGFKLYPISVARQIGPGLERGFSSTLQLSLGTALQSLDIITLPHDWHGRSAGESKFHLLKEGVPYLRVALRSLTKHRR